MIAEEPLAAQLGPQSCPVLVADRRVRPLAQFAVVRDDSPRQLAPELARRRAYRERLAEARVHLGAGRGRALLERVRIRVPALPEQRDHLRLVDHVARLRAAVQPGEPATEPHAGRLAALAVVLAEVGVAGVGGVVGRHLPGQVGVAVAGAELVQVHHRSAPVRARAGRSQRTGAKPGRLLSRRGEEVARTSVGVVMPETVRIERTGFLPTSTARVGRKRFYRPGSNTYLRRRTGTATTGRTV